MLSSIGAMSAGGVDGVYGNGTTMAVRRFQEWVNRTRGEGTLPVTGQVDNATRLALEYAYDHELTLTEATAQPTEAPTPEPTAQPTEAPTPQPTEAPAEPEGDNPEAGGISVGEGSDPESIRFVQEMLSAVGVFSGEANGVYDDSTIEAVKRFQQWVNRVQGDSTLPVTGQVDDRTRQALEYAYDHEYAIDAGSVQPEEPQGVGAVGDIAVRFGDTVADGGVVTVPEGSFTVQWAVDGDVEGYAVTILDGSGSPVAPQQTTDQTSFTMNTSRMNPGEIYTLRLGVMPQRGTQDDVVWKEVRFTLPAPEATQAPTPEPTAEPTEAPPAVGTVSAPSITVAGVPAGNGPVTIEGDTFGVSWAADGDVQGYRVRLTDQEGREITRQDVTDTSATLRSDNMEPGVVYTLSVGALPVNGTENDFQWASAQFTRNERPTPEPTEAPTPAPTAAAIGKPVITLGGTAVQHDGVPYMTDSSIIISWNADGNVAAYRAYVENQSGEQHELSTGTDTSSTVNAASLPAGVYTVYVGALPVNGTESDVQWSSARFGIPSPTAQPTEAPPQEPTPQPTIPAPSGPISAASDAETLQQLQMRLYSLGLLSASATPSELDEATLAAVYEFQTRVNQAYELDLPVVDPSDPDAVIDAATVTAIFTDLPAQP